LTIYYITIYAGALHRAESLFGCKITKNICFSM
jgi:hypothetical protein